MTRRALVIGCGGTIGGAWTIAALDALARELDWDPAAADVLQGTSAGAEIVTLLAGGHRTADLVRMQSGTTADPVLRRHLDDTPPSLPRIPGPAALSPSTLWTRRGGHAPLTGIAPRGRGDASWLQRLAESAAGPDGTLPHPGARLVAYEPATGDRVAFGAPEVDWRATAPSASAGEALRASWAIPAWMPPVRIDGRMFVDGGAASTASVDLIGPEDADEVFVIASMASAPGVRGPGLGGALEHAALRGPMSAVLWDEVRTVRRRGIDVTVITPTAEDLAGLGANFMARGHRRAAFDSALVTAPRAVRAALAPLGVRR